MKAICVKCLKTLNNPREIRIKPLGYGSLFDECGTSFCLCEDCYNKHKIWWDLEKEVEEELLEVTGQTFYRYKFEDDIKDWLDALPLRGQEIVYNTNWVDFNFDGTIKPEVWINNELINYGNNY